MLSWFIDLPWEMQALLLFLVFVVVGVGAHWLTLAASRGDVTRHLDHPRLVIGPVSTSLALLLGFGVMITWGGISAAETATESEAVAARQVGWALELNSGEVSASLPSDQAQTTLDSLMNYLLLAGSSSPAVGQGNTNDSPNVVAMRTFQRSVRQLIFDPTVLPAQATSLQAAADQLAAAEADSQAIASRRLPLLFLALILINALLLAAMQGIIFTAGNRPWVALGWGALVALAITVVIQMDGPFSGDISVTRQALTDVAAWLGAGGP